MKGTFTDRLAIAMFAVGALACGFGYGVAVGVYRFFPYEPLSDAKAAADAVVEKYTIGPDPYAEVVAHDRSGVTVHDPDRAFEGYTFLMANRNGEYGASLIDMAGRTLHEWGVRFSEVWPDAPHVLSQAKDDQIYWHGAHLFPNGDLLFNFGGGNFPYGGGLVKLDKDSNVLWSLPRNTHHALDVARDGNVYVVAHNFRRKGLSDLPNLKPPFLEDVVLKVSADGEVLDEISMLRALQGSGYGGLLSLTYGEHVNLDSEDPLHLNGVEVLPEHLGSEFPKFEPGDLLVSFRDINTIAVLDPRTERIRWAMTGKFVHQHDPDFLANGNILLFDNRGGNGEYGQSQILEINPNTQEIVWRYTGNAQRPFFSEIRGLQQPLPNGNVLITESDGGRLLEVTRTAEPKIVWEYYNAVASDDGENKVGVISAGLRVKPEALTFLK